MPHHAVVIRRDELDEQLRRRARNAGATVLMGHEATTPISERGFVRGATMTLADGTIRDVNARFIVVADGASSRFGRVLGTSRQRRWPYAIAARTYFSSPRHRDAWVETSLGLSDPQGNPVAGYGWVTPMGDGNVNVGVGVLSSYRDIKGLNTLKLLTAFSDHVAADWGLDPTQPLKSPTRLRLPIGGSVGPKMGPTFLVVGDAAGAANPFSGDGIDAALMGGRLAANVLHEALTTGNSTTLQRYPVVVAEEVEAYRKVGRLSARFLGRPAILKPALRLATRSDATMGAVLRIATNALRDDDTAGGAERAYRLASLAAKFAPSW
jgi:menaquinone-9 beta-reductase